MRTSDGLVDRGVWWELMAECARVSPGSEVHELELTQVTEPLRWSLRLYKEAVGRARDRGDAEPDRVARAEVFDSDLPEC